jgi:hypothetical protein
MAGRPSADPTLKIVLGASDQRLRKHSSLYDWMLEHHAAIKAEFEKNGPQWEARVEAMGNAGLTDRTGKPATKRVAQNTWYSVCRAVEGKRPSKAAAAPAEVTPQALSASPPPKAEASGDEDEDEEEIEITMGDGTPRKVRIPKRR